MSKVNVTFNGDPQLQPGKKRGGPSDPDSIEMFGLQFELGVPTTIDLSTPNAAKILAKLRANSHFTVEDADEEKVPAKAETAAERKAREKAEREAKEKAEKAE